MELKTNVADAFEKIDFFGSHALAVGAQGLEEAGDVLNGERNEALLCLRIGLGEVILGFDVQKL